MSKVEIARRASEDPASCARRHLRIGWSLLLIFLTLGIVLESLHGFKVGWYVNASNEVRQVMWRLAHAHGKLVAQGTPREILERADSESLEKVFITIARGGRLEN